MQSNFYGRWLSNSNNKNKRTNDTDGNGPPPYPKRSGPFAAAPDASDDRRRCCDAVAVWQHCHCHCQCQWWWRPKKRQRAYGIRNHMYSLLCSPNFHERVDRQLSVLKANVAQHVLLVFVVAGHTNPMFISRYLISLSRLLIILSLIYGLIIMKVLREITALTRTVPYWQSIFFAISNNICCDTDIF